MKKLLVAILFLGVFISCEKTSKKPSLEGSVGNTNTIKMVVDKDLWQGRVGDTLRSILAAPVDGLPREEPLFTLDQITPDKFTGFVSKSRNFLSTKLGEPSSFSIEEDVTARRQTAVMISGEDEDAIIEVFKTNKDKIIEAFKTRELKNTQARIRSSLKKTDSLKATFGVNMRFPTAYDYVKKEKNFFWMRKEIKRSGNMNITVYEVPLHAIDQDTFSVARIVRMRDSVSGANVGLNQGRFVTELSLAPQLFESEIDGRFAWEMKGTWEVRDGRLMAGPFINYAIRDEKNNRYVVVEGFIFSPSLDQRDNMFELEAIIKSTRFLDK
ncbi:DUF4837 domain-containing protein [Dokdonia pacifica]|uniref:DUF4837 domain-containing protein n=1 Tax=Dokdonia pacifica TaxID=1627892 RepID=A0A238WG14_9FLAO|nr:DUF4837 family protein [Dokdonia pacifica]GGG20873.1 DUF4837 domain-containing protein [Dokdonia pacifica]SNR45388.1 protein of unknown function [Dokdonia pacifica]